MGIVKQFLNNREYKLPINLYKLNPCREWVLAKIRLNGLYVKVYLIMNELNYRGITVEETAGMLTKIMQLSEKHSVERVVEIMERYAKSKRADERIDGSV